MIIVGIPRPRDASCLSYCAVADSKCNWWGLLDGGAKPDQSRNAVVTYPVELQGEALMLPAVGSDRGWIMFSPQTKRTRVCLGPDRDHLFNKVSVRLFWSAPECDWCVHTMPNELLQGGKCSRVRLNRTKSVKTPSEVIMKDILESIRDDRDLICPAVDQL